MDVLVAMVVEAMVVGGTIVVVAVTELVVDAVVVVDAEDALTTAALRPAAGATARTMAKSDLDLTSQRG